MRTIEVPGARKVVQEWLPKLLKMANGQGLELAPGIVLQVPDTTRIGMEVGDDGRLLVTLPETKVSIDATEYCIHIRGTQPMGALSVSEQTATGSIEGIPFDQGRFLLKFTD